MSYEFIDYLKNGIWMFGSINCKKQSRSYTKKC